MNIIILYRYVTITLLNGFQEKPEHSMLYIDKKQNENTNDKRDENINKFPNAFPMLFTSPQGNKTYSCEMLLQLYGTNYI